MICRSAALATFIALSLWVAGCDEDLETRPPVYPEAIGYTPPPSVAVSPAPVGSSSEVPVGVDDDDTTQGEPPASDPEAPGDGTEVPAQAGEPGPATYADTDPAALADFRPALDPYGSWVDNPTYGTVWVPSPSEVGDDFTPYLTDGHWAYDDDYTWVSDYSWGWAPFHFGRWVYDSALRWAWVPGRRYSGAWVSWRYGEGGYGYVGWAPTAPTWAWRDGVAAGIGVVPRSPYNFVETRALFASNLVGQTVAGPQVAFVAAHTHPWTGRGLVGGPPPASLGIGQSAVVHSAPGDRGLLQARAWARPPSAMPLGARTQSAAAYRGVTRSPVAGPLPSAQSGRELSHFGGRLGAGFSGGLPAPGFPRSLPGAPPPSAGFGAAPRWGSGAPAGRRFGGMTSAPPARFHWGGGHAWSGGHGGFSGGRPSGGGRGGGGHRGGHR